MTSVLVGQKISYSIAQFDTTGEPMSAAAPYDAPPSWAGSDAAVETISASPDGATAEGVAVGSGNDTVTVTAMVGGVSFSAMTVTAVAVPPQALGSIQIVATVQ